MRKFVRCTFFAASQVVLIAPFAQAMPLEGPQLLARIHDAEFRGYTRTSRGFENQIWRFLPDGRVSAVADSQRRVSQGGNYRLEWQDTGAWRVEGDRVCVLFSGLNQNLNGCYTVELRHGDHVRLIGPYGWEGTLAH